MSKLHIPTLFIVICFEMKRKLDRRIIILSVVLYLALSIPISVLHELGHVVVCSASGYEYQIWVDASGGHTVCSGNSSVLAPYNTFGGIFGLIGSGAIIGVWLLTTRKHAWILVVGLAYLVDQTGKVVLEGFMMAAYSAGRFDGYVTALQLTSWIGLTLYFAARTRSEAEIRK